jgi:hypothetical protein
MASLSFRKIVVVMESKNTSRGEEHTVERVQQVVNELAQGKLPTTAQATRALDVLERQVIPEASRSNLSSTGEKALRQTEVLSLLPLRV